MIFLKHFLVFLFFCASAFTQKNTTWELYDHLNYTTTRSGNVDDIQQVVEKFEKGEFTKDKVYNTHKHLADSIYWFHIAIPAHLKSKDLRFNYVAPYIYETQLYSYVNGTITAHNKYSTYPNKNQHFNHFYYRHPVWKLNPKKGEEGHLFFKINNNAKQRTRIEMHLETENAFLKRIQYEHILMGLFLAILIAIVLGLTYFAVLKKEYSVVFYALYVCCAIVEFMAAKSIGVQLFWKEHIFVIHNIRSSTQTLGFLFLGLFYFSFYKYRKVNKIHQNIFLFGVIIASILYSGYILKFFIGGMQSYFLYVWVVLKIAMLVFLINHLTLSFKKYLPIYLAIAFTLPKISLLVIQNISISMTAPKLIWFLVDNMYYVLLVFEVFIFTRYIFKAVIKSQKKYNELIRINDNLKNSFDNEILQTQLNERNDILGNIHDTFGGYIEALKLRLNLVQFEEKNKVDEIIDALNNDYRFLLNNLYSPQINASNFASNIESYCNKLNLVTKIDIQTEIEITTPKISKDICIHLYRIISELVTNAIKHSKCSKVLLTTKETKDALKLQISDNGIGFKPEEVNSFSFGIANLKRRIALMNASCEVNSSKEKGTMYIIVIPLV